MKKFLLLATMLMSFAAFAKNYTVGIKGMHCESCVEKITGKFQTLPDVASVTIDLKTESMTLVMKKDKTITEDLIKKTVSDAGYTVSSIK